ncbi:MAG: hypothetical protein V3V99_05895 [candidate division Zixibacteria bacterium]
MKNKVKKPDLKILAQYVKGNKDIMKYWSKFIENDPESRSKATVLKKLFNMFQSLNFNSNRQPAIDMANAIFDNYRKRNKKSKIARARLFFDSRYVPLPEGLRRSMISERRMRYVFDSGLIELAILPVFPGKFELTGKIDRESIISIRAQLRGRKIYNSRIDANGFFSFAVVNPGQYSLYLTWDKTKTMVDTLELR